MHWHYSQAMPIGKTISLGVWEDSTFIGAVLFGRGASPALGKPYGLTQTECCELVRVALREHASPVSQIVAQSLYQLRETNPGLRLVVSFADPAQGHLGGIYQAGNWLYLGTSSPSDEVQWRGRWYHNRMLRPTGWGTVPQIARLSDEQKAALPRRRTPGKHRYVYPLDRGMRRKISKIALPYPARGEVLNGSDVPTRDVGRVRSPGTARTETP